MMNFYQMFRKFNVPEKISERNLGLIVVESVMINRIEQNRVWRTGDAKDYRVKEMRRVIAAIDDFVKDTTTNPASPDALNIKYSHRLNAHRNIEKICFLYDVVKFIYQREDGDGALKISHIADFVGEKMPGASLRKPDILIQYQRENESPREEYSRILTNLRNGLVNRYDVVLQTFDD